MRPRLTLSTRYDPRRLPAHHEPPPGHFQHLMHHCAQSSETYCSCTLDSLAPTTDALPPYSLAREPAAARPARPSPTPHVARAATLHRTKPAMVAPCGARADARTHRAAPSRVRRPRRRASRCPPRRPRQAGRESSARPIARAAPPSARRARSVAADGRPGGASHAGPLVTNLRPPAPPPICAHLRRRPSPRVAAPCLPAQPSDAHAPIPRRVVHVLPVASACGLACCAAVLVAHAARGWRLASSHARVQQRARGCTQLCLCATCALQCGDVMRCKAGASQASEMQGGAHLGVVEPGAPRSRRPSYVKSPSRECSRRLRRPRRRGFLIIICPPA
jgi:hypothetical protein